MRKHWYLLFYIVCFIVPSNLLIDFSKSKIKAYDQVKCFDKNFQYYACHMLVTYCSDF